MAYFTKYYRFDAFFSHSSNDESWYPQLFLHFADDLKAAFVAKPWIANRRIPRDLSEREPKIHSLGRNVGRVFGSGDLRERLHESAQDSLIFVAFIGHNYLTSAACLTELAGFLESKRDARALKASLYVTVFGEVTSKWLFDPMSNPELELIPDADEYNLVVDLAQRIAARLKALYGDPGNLPLNQPLRSYDPEIDAAVTRSTAKGFAIKLVNDLQDSRVIVDPERAGDACREGWAKPLVVLRPMRRMPARGTHDATVAAPQAPVADPEDQAISALEQLSRGAPDRPPLCRYVMPPQKLIYFANGESASPFDPQLQDKPKGVVITREASAAFDMPTRTLLDKLRNQYGTLQISVAPPAPQDGVLAIAADGGTTVFQPEAAAQAFVRDIQSRYT